MLDLHVFRNLSEVWAMTSNLMTRYHESRSYDALHDMAHMEVSDGRNKAGEILQTCGLKWGVLTFPLSSVYPHRMKSFKTDDLPDELLERNFDVTVLVQTYNHELYIERCLRSILSQDFDQSLGLVVIDDSSTDSTLNVIERVISEVGEHSKFDIFVISHLTNQFQRGRTYIRGVLNSLVSKFFAFCDGDDAWRDSRKLQKQYAFLMSKAGESFSACGHDSTVVDDQGLIVEENKLPLKSRRDYDAIALKQCDCFILSNTLFFRGEVKFPVHLGNVPNGDNVLWSTFGFYGAFKFMGEVENSIYTRHSESFWSSNDANEKRMMKAETFLRLARFYYQSKELELATSFLGKCYTVIEEFKN